ncbi:hypothetical protein BDD43_5428 [Mucilaginibacter gracilis]|uniref:Outer membrane protein beta-barrel domain-containing protein n=1 Tax=Mucilaginibacter gracilis TaxID=423350 RepID=A0A495J8F3_9SPHI|nr:hypothetical protein [Mucilaginibacter gracilis]RKR85167.1 hypothetical protein BDD43_5428 [Mucilaginibacter gracilis]
MRLLTLLTFLFLFNIIPYQAAVAQNNGFTIGLSTMWPDYGLPRKDDGSATLSTAIDLGYRTYILKNAHLSTGFSGFFELYDCPFTLAGSTDPKDALKPLKSLYGTTVFTGIGITPSWCFNPDGDWTFSVAVKLKAGNYYGWGTVQGQDAAGNTINYDKQSANAGLGVAWSPRLVLERDIDSHSIGLLIGWDSTDFGKGVRSLRSTYYPNQTYRSSAIVLGVIVRL